MQVSRKGQFRFSKLKGEFRGGCVALVLTLAMTLVIGVYPQPFIELLYHFWDGGGLTLRTSLPREEPHIATLTDLIPGAAFYEREVSEMLGVTFDGHPDLRALLLPAE